MKIKPVILCGGAGTRLWPRSKNNLAKQFIDFGGWNLFERTLERIKNPIFDTPIISTNSLYLKLVKKYLKKNKFNRYNIILEPSKKNTASAILSSALLHEVSFDQPMIFFPSDHLLEKTNQFNNVLVFNTRYLDNYNIFVFGIKPQYPSSQYGYFLTKKTSKGINAVTKFIEKPSPVKAKQIIIRKGYWNSGILFANKMSIINNFSKHQKTTLNLCIKAVFDSTKNKNLYFLSKKPFKKIVEKSFDYAILEKSKNINGIRLNIPWSDLGSWDEITIYLKK
jgi:Mannose-1-phosphate guanylyltransferase